jgi:hypothetical protein
MTNISNGFSKHALHKQKIFNFFCPYVLPAIMT